MTVYLDHAATTPLRPGVLEAMVPWLSTGFGNPSGSHRMAREARRAIDEARDVVAACLGCAPGEVVFTAGGTEADNLAIAGAVAAARRLDGRATAVCSAIEHHAVLHSVEAVGGRVVPVDAGGVIDLDALGAALTPEVAVVSVMLANNEVGVIQPITDVVALARERAPNALVHTDAVQAAAWLPIALATNAVDLVAIAAHKFGGPKGVGALVVRAGRPRIEPLLRGGGQEHDLRSGTHNVAGIVGMAAALQEATDEREDVGLRVQGWRDQLGDALRAGLDGVVETGSRANRLPNLLHLRIAGIESESLLVLLDDAGVCASAGSACASGAMDPSHVLLAMGIERRDALSSLRLSLGRTTTSDDVEFAAVAIIDAVNRLRATSPTPPHTAASASVSAIA